MKLCLICGGNDQRRVNIIINGHRFEVSETLGNALLRLRDRKSCSLLWVDAICINQYDVQERNQQIKIMRYIYTRAQHVVVWIQSTRDSDYWGYPPARTESFEALCGNLYWSRMWIVQEIVNARDISILYHPAFLHVKQPIGWAEVSHSSSRVWFGPSLLNELRGRKHTLEITELLIKHKRAGCLDPRDKIYGLVGLSNSCNGFPIDYTKTLLEVWRDTISWFIVKGLAPEREFLAWARFLRDLLGIDKVTSIKGMLQELGETYNLQNAQTVGGDLENQTQDSTESSGLQHILAVLSAANQPTKPGLLRFAANQASQSEARQSEFQFILAILPFKILPLQTRQAEQWMGFF